MRCRASITSTERPARASASAAASPDAPAPMTMTSKERVLFRLHAGVGGHLAPDADFLLDLLAEILWSAARGRDAVALQLVGGLLDLERLGGLGVDAIDDRPRQAFRADQAVPEDDG